MIAIRTCVLQARGARGNHLVVFVRVHPERNIRDKTCPFACKLSF